MRWLSQSENGDLFCGLSVFTSVHILLMTADGTGLERKESIKSEASEAESYPVRQRERAGIQGDSADHGISQTVARSCIGLRLASVASPSPAIRSTIPGGLCPALFCPARFPADLAKAHLDLLRYGDLVETPCGLRSVLVDPGEPLRAYCESTSLLLKRVSSQQTMLRESKHFQSIISISSR